MDKDYIEDLLSDTGVKCKFTNFKWIADLTFDIEPDTIGLEGYRLVSNDYGTKITASIQRSILWITDIQTTNNISKQYACYSVRRNSR